jgi:hypothetical protein
VIIFEIECDDYLLGGIFAPTTQNLMRKELKISLITGFVEDVPVHGGIVYFNDWLKTDQGVTREELRENLVVEGRPEGDIEFHFEDLENIFFAWCELHNLQGQIV